MLSRTLDGFLVEFGQQVEQAQSDLQPTRDLPEIIDAALALCNSLAVDIPLDAYTELHSMCLPYFSHLKQFLGDPAFGQAALQTAFLRSIAFPRLMSRLYVGLLIACSECNSKHLHTVSQMLPAVAHPLRAFLLRYTASTLFPKESERYLSFTVENLKQMLELLPRFKELYPDAMQSASGWLTANVSISLLKSSNRELIGRFLELARECREEGIALAIVACVVHSIESESIHEFFPLLKAFFSRKTPGESVRGLAIKCCEICDRPKTIFEFILGTPYADDCGMEITKIALNHGDLDVLRQCGSQWRENEDVVRLLLDLGPNLFAEIVSELRHGLSVTNQFIRKVDSETLPENIRKMLQNELFERSPELDQDLCALFKRLPITEHFITVVFAEPFRFSGDLLIKYVLTAAMRLRLPFESLLDFLGRTTDFRAHLTFLVNIYDRRRGDELVDVIVRSDKIDTFRVLISKLIEFDVTEAKLEGLLSLCRTDIEFRDFCFLAASKDFRPLLQAAMDAYLKCDACLGTIREQLALYFGALNVIACLSRVEDVFGDGFVLGLLKHVLSLFALEDQLFPILTPDDRAYYAKMVAAMHGAAGLASVRDEIVTVLGLLAGK
jgi:hypothetical protein